ncbi:MAG: DUF4177 domain-containing protein [Rhodobacteraceae bacterium]|nr:DUF4177 domain-containing protein [Paracoccaceae bacterium]
MTQYEYKVVPAPGRGEKAKGVRAPEARFALALETLMNRLAEDGWEYLRAEMLPSEERQGLTGTTTNWRNMLVFRRPRRDSAEDFRPRLLGAPQPADPAAGIPAPPATATPAQAPAVAETAAAQPAAPAVSMPPPRPDPPAPSPGPHFSAQPADPETPAAPSDPGPSTAPAPPQSAPPPAPAATRSLPRPGDGASRMLRDNGVEDSSDVAGMTTALMARAARTLSRGPKPAADTRAESLRPQPDRAPPED